MPVSSVLALLSISLIVQLTYGFCPSFIEKQNACTCFSYVDGAVIKCSGLNGPKVVAKLVTAQTEIRELAIEHANIVEIGPRAFRNLRIRKLVLDNNRIKTIDGNAFRGLETTIQELSLSYNKLTEIPTDSLMGMTNLKVLDLKCNQIGDIYGSMFRNVSRLIELNLACNRICKIQGPAFNGLYKSLQNLILDQNCLQEIPSEALRNVDNLIGLHLQYNQISTVGKLQLMNMTNLLMLKLTGNRIKTVDKHGLLNVHNLRYLYLNDNQLDSFESGTFQQFGALEIIDLSHNNITKVVDGSFAELERLIQLNLEGNAIMDVAPGAFANTPLLLLMMGDNCLTTLNQNMFRGIPFLRQLSISNNNIRLVQPLSFAHLANLQMIDLSGNKIQVVHPEALIASSHTTVMLIENPLVCSQNGYHIVQGEEPIHLLNEPNKICKSDFTLDITDKCPTRKERPPIPPCCQKFKQKKTETTIAPLTTTQKLFIEKTTTISTQRKAPSHSINMERFLRLSRRPTGQFRRKSPRKTTTTTTHSTTTSITTTTTVIEHPSLNDGKATIGTVSAIALRPKVTNDSLRSNRGRFLPNSGLFIRKRPNVGRKTVNRPKVSLGSQTNNSPRESVIGGRPRPPAIQPPGSIPPPPTSPLFVLDGPVVNIPHNQQFSSLQAQRFDIRPQERRPFQSQQAGQHKFQPRIANEERQQVQSRVEQQQFEQVGQLQGPDGRQQSTVPIQNLKVQLLRNQRERTQSIQQTSQNVPQRQQQNQLAQPWRQQQQSGVRIEQQQRQVQSQHQQRQLVRKQQQLKQTQEQQRLNQFQVAKINRQSIPIQRRRDQSHHQHDQVQHQRQQHIQPHSEAVQDQRSVQQQQQQQRIQPRSQKAKPQEVYVQLQDSQRVQARSQSVQAQPQQQQQQQQRQQQQQQRQKQQQVETSSQKLQVPNRRHRRPPPPPRRRPVASRTSQKQQRQQQQQVQQQNQQQQVQQEQHSPSVPQINRARQFQVPSSEPEPNDRNSKSTLPNQVLWQLPPWIKMDSLNKQNVSFSSITTVQNQQERGKQAEQVRTTK